MLSSFLIIIKYFLIYFYLDEYFVTPLFSPTSALTTLFSSCLHIIIFSPRGCQPYLLTFESVLASPTSKDKDSKTLTLSTYNSLQVSDIYVFYFPFPHPLHFFYFILSPLLFSLSTLNPNYLSLPFQLYSLSSDSFHQNFLHCLRILTKINRRIVMQFAIFFYHIMLTLY